MFKNLVDFIINAEETMANSWQNCTARAARPFWIL